MVGKPVIDAGEDRGGAVLPNGQSGGGVVATDLGLDGVEIADECHAFLGNRRRARAGDLDQLAARVCPATRELDALLWRCGNRRSGRRRFANGAHLAPESGGLIAGKVAPSTWLGKNGEIFTS